jgi:hypothetical protein
MRGMTALRSAVRAGMLLVLCSVPPAAAQTPDATLPSQCLDQQVAPVSVTFTCADGGFIAHDLVWSGWGSPQPHATGTASINDCEPSCAGGQFKDYAIELVADQLRVCEIGKPQYTVVTYHFPKGGPFRSDDGKVDFPCPRRRHANPRIKRMRLRFSTHGAGNGRSFVRVRVAMRVCAVRGRSSVVLSETKRLGGRTFGSGIHSFKFRQRKACQSHSFHWRLGDRLLGVGTYRVAATVSDVDFQYSKTVSRKSVTTD